MQKHNGFLIYAGGDDVLAILPLEDALPCAKALRDTYLQAFEGSGIGTTLSGAIEFAHVKMPLGRILTDAHELLDKIAKDGRGRDAIAARVWKPGGCALTWAQPWSIALNDAKTVMLQDIAQTLESDREVTPDAAAAFSNTFFYRIRERFDLLNPTDSTVAPVLNEEQAIALLAAEYVSSGVHLAEVHQQREPGAPPWPGKPRPSLQQAQQWVRPLLQQCRPVQRVTDATGKHTDDIVSSCLEADGALLVRFLAHKGVEPGGER